MTNTVLTDKTRELGFILKDLLKVIKVVSQYPEDNPLPQSLRQSFSEKLVSVVNTHGELHFEISCDHIDYQNSILYEDHPPDERLSALLFESGITDIVFHDGIDVDEVYRLLDAIKKYQNTPGRELDLPTLIWETNLARFSFKTVEDVALGEYDQNFRLDVYRQNKDKRIAGQAVFGADASENYQAIFSGSDSCKTDCVIHENEISIDDIGSGQVNIGPSSGGINKTAQMGLGVPDDNNDVGIDSGTADFLADVADILTGDDEVQNTETPSDPPDTRIIINREFNASDEDNTAIALLLEEDAAFDEYESTLEIIKELLLQEGEMNAFYETVTISEKILGEFIAHARLIEARQLLQYMQDLIQRLKKDKGLWAERLKDAIATAGSRERLGNLAETLNNHPEVGVSEIIRYLECFGWEALGTITDLLGEFEHRMHREALKDFLTAAGNNNLEIISKGIFDKRWFVVRNAITILGRLSDPRVMKYLHRVVDHEELRVRQELVQVLADCEFNEALEILKRLVEDPESEIRNAAVKGIVKRHGPEAFEVITEIINADNFPNLNKKEQQLLLNAYSILGGDAAVAYLAQLISRWNLFRDGGLRYYRRAAFEALCHNRGEKAQRQLTKFASSLRRDIHNQAVDAVQRRREIVFGSNEE